MEHRKITGEVYSLFAAQYDEERQPIAGEMGVVDFDKGEYYMIHIPNRTDLLLAGAALITGDRVTMTADCQERQEPTSLLRVESYSGFCRIGKGLKHN